MPLHSATPWTILVVDDDEGVHQVTQLALRRAKFFGLPVEIKSAMSKQHGLEVMGECNPERLAVALVDVVMEHDTAGLEMVGALRERFGSPLQIVLRTGQPGVMAPEEVTLRYDISNYIAKAEATPEKLRTAVGLGIRNFRTGSAMRVLCESLATFTSLFDTATSKTAVDDILAKALLQYAAVWQFEYLFVADMHELQDPSALDPWRASAYKQIRSLELNSHGSVSFGRLWSAEGNECWGCTVKPLGGRFSAAFALLQSIAPSEILLRELHTLLRTWALARESVVLKQHASNERLVRAEMHRERSEAIAQMVAGVAHEVNTPLGVANAAAATLKEVLSKQQFVALGAQQELAEDLDDVQTAANLIQRNIARADELIRSFRQLSVRQLVDQREEVDFMVCIQDAVKLYSPKAKRVGMQINVKNEMDPKLTRWLGYPGHLSQVLLNLITNAERYAYDGQAGVVDLIVSSGTVDDVPEFRIVVRDYGKGIPAASLPLIFEAFYTTGRSKGGTGLGLSIVRNVIQSVFAGKVSCESTVGEGTAFKLSFSHCSEKAKGAAAGTPDDSADRAKIFQEFVDLQHRLIAADELTAVEQVRIAELRVQVESFLAMQFQSNERRAHPRIPCSRDVRVVVGSLEFAAVRMLDLSEGGAQLSIPQDVPVGQTLRITVSEQPNFVVDARVVSCLNEDGSAKVGVSFPELHENDMRVLRLILAETMLEYWR